MRPLVWVVALSLAGAVAWGVSRYRAGAATIKEPEPPGVDAFLAPYQDELRASRRPVARIALEPFASDDTTVSKVGGRAWWPQGQSAPTGTDGTPLALLAQINFAEVPEMAGYPKQGLLQFFIAATDFYGANFEGEITPDRLSEQRDFRVVYWPDISLSAQALPVAASDLLPHAPSKPRRMRFARDEEALSVGDYRFESLMGGNAYAAAETYGDVHGVSSEALFDAIAERHNGTGHKMGGYPYFTQTDPRTGGDLELLLQLDSDDEMMWGDAGVGNFFISPADLARADFSRVAYTWDCH